MIKAILFDIGGTLHTSTTSNERTIRYCADMIERLADYDIHIDVTPETLATQLHANAEAYKQYSEKTLKEDSPAKIWNSFYLKEYHIGEEKLAPIAEELSFLYDYARPKVLRRPHMVETIQLLKKEGYRIGVISNMISTSVVPHFLAEYGIAQYMDCVIVSAACGSRKPGTDIFRLAEKEMGLLPEELCYVGDTISRDVRGTRDAGWRLMIQISNPAMAHRDVGLEKSGYTPDYLITDLSQIPAILAAENNKEA